MNKERHNSKSSIPCRVTLGMFPDERGVSVDLPEGETIEIFAHKNHVIADQDPVPGGEVKGRVIVRIVEKLEDSMVVDLPQPGINVGMRHIVPKSMVKVGGDS